jgi:hypothetical protein
MIVVIHHYHQPVLSERPLTSRVDYDRDEQQRRKDQLEREYVNNPIRKINNYIPLRKRMIELKSKLKSIRRWKTLPDLTGLSWETVEWIHAVRNSADDVIIYPPFWPSI